MKFVDSHVHLDHIFSAHPDRILWLKENECTPVSWSFCNKTESIADIQHCLANHSDTIRQLSKTGLNCYYLAGIHPRNITPDLATADIRELILPYLDDPLCLGIGEVGLETGVLREVEILLAHLELAGEVADREKIFGIHTPRNDKENITSQILDLLKPYADYQDRIVIDHCTPRIIEEVLSFGLWAGVTLSPVKAGIQDVLDIISRHSRFSSRIMLNTDSGTLFYKDLHEFVRTGEVDMTIKTELVRSNAGKFFGIKDGIG